MSDLERMEHERVTEGRSFRQNSKEFDADINSDGNPNS